MTFEIVTNFELADPEIDYRNVTVDYLSIPMDPTSSATLYTNMVDGCYQMYVIVVRFVA